MNKRLAERIELNRQATQEYLDNVDILAPPFSSEDPVLDIAGSALFANLVRQTWKEFDQWVESITPSRRKIEKPQIGSYSHGSHRTEDILNGIKSLLPLRIVNEIRVALNKGDE